MITSPPPTTGNIINYHCCCSTTTTITTTDSESPPPVFMISLRTALPRWFLHIKVPSGLFHNDMISVFSPVQPQGLPASSHNHENTPARHSSRVQIRPSNQSQYFREGRVAWVSFPVASSTETIRTNECISFLCCVETTILILDSSVDRANNSR